MRPFRILYIDDTVYDAVYSRRDTILSASPEEPQRILRKISEIAAKKAGAIECFLARDLSFEKRSVLTIHSDGSQWEMSHLWALDVLILDLKGTGPLREEWQLKPGELAGATEAEIESLNEDFPGAAFYLKNRDRLRACQLIVIFSQADGSGADPVIKNHLDIHCSPATVPATVKYPITRDSISKISGIIEVKYKAFSDGYTQLDQHGSIEWAASHDLPVLIVGETGTGKEMLARSIHERWVQEKVRTRTGQRKHDYGFTIVNCASLSPELARSELFGHVRGAFTGATSHNLGAILEACGLRRLGLRRRRKGNASSNDVGAEIKEFTELVQSLDKANAAATEEERVRILAREVLYRLNQYVNGNRLFKDIEAFYRQLQRAAGDPEDSITDYERKVEEANGELVDVEFDMIRFKEEGPFGTLFLDEFGDLAPEVQTLLLRYLEDKTKEVQPLGYPGRFSGANARIIAATSDPRIAGFVNEKLSGHRSRSEYSRPIREDLIFRIKGQVIRAEAVTPENVEACVRHFTERSNEKWENEAVARLIGKVRMLLDLIATRERSREALDGNESGALAGEPIPAFGHRREIDRFVSLASEYVRTADERGLRTIGNSVTADIVERLWRNSHIQQWEIAADPSVDIPSSPDSGSSAAEARRKDAMARERQLRSVISELAAEMGIKLNADGIIKSSVIKGIANELQVQFLSKFAADGIGDTAEATLALERQSTFHEFRGLIEARIGADKTAELFQPALRLLDFRKLVFDCADLSTIVFGVKPGAHRHWFKGLLSESPRGQRVSSVPS